MDLETLLFEVSGGVALITLNRPERLNAMNRPMLRDIQTALDRVEDDEAIRAVVVTGAGRSFSSGFDLKEQMEAQPEGEAAWRKILTDDFDAVTRFWWLKKPTIAAVRGHCLAGACELALACDITVSAEDAVFGEPELKFGAGIVALLMPWMTGPKQAKELILTGEDRLPARRALELGLINRVVPNGEEVHAAMALARHIAAMDPELVMQTKRAINRTCEIMGMRQALREALEIDLEIETKGSPDKKRFMEIARKDGLRAAYAWREERFAAAAKGK
ncbi:MAG: enoyl-CoA hydratase/isomerase family protein [SAR324 cluster bacterium]|nr:enoyl-CoA hydratase/isomerase family protein [SAR324 cluster bacterium]